MWIVLFVVLLDIVGFGILLPIFPFFAGRLGAGPELVMILIALYMAAAFVSAPFLGKLSDRYGRKPVMAISLLGATIGYVMLAFASNLWVVAIARVLSGLMAGNFSAAQAYITDSTTEEDRARYMGFFGAAMALGYVIGPLIGSAFGGASFEEANFTGPALIAGALSLIAFFAVVFLVEESVSAEQMQSTEQKKATLLEDLRTISVRPTLLAVIACSLLYNTASGLYEVIFPLWAERLGVIEGPRGMLPMLLVSGLTYVFVQAAVFAPLTKRFDSRRLLMYSAIGLSIAVFAMTAAGNVGSAVWVTVAMMVTAFFAGIILPGLQVLVANMAAEQERGIVLGVMGSIGTLGRTIATVASGVLFGQLHVHGPYFSAVVLVILLAALAATLPKHL